MLRRILLISLGVLLLVALILIAITHHLLPWWHNYTATRTISECQYVFAARSASPSRVSALPTQMPENFALTYYHHGGMLPSHEEVIFGTSTLSIELVDSRQKKRQFTEPLSPKTRTALYALVRVLAFDKVVTAKDTEVKYDAAGESITITTGYPSPTSTITISLGATTHLEESWIPHWQTLDNCIERLISHYR